MNEHWCFFCNRVGDMDNPVEKVRVGNGFLWLCRKHMLLLRDELDNRLKALSEVELLKAYAGAMEKRG